MTDWCSYLVYEFSSFKAIIDGLTNYQSKNNSAIFHLLSLNLHSTNFNF
jgi:hypothetical protein